MDRTSRERITSDLRSLRFLFDSRWWLYVVYKSPFLSDVRKHGQNDL